MNKNKNTSSIIIILVVVVVAVFGYLAYSRYSKPLGNSGQEVLIGGQASDVSEATTSFARTVTTPLAQTYIGEEDVLTYAWNGSEEEKSRYFDALLGFAVSTRKVSIGEGCTMNPKIAKIENNTITIINEDSVDHTLLRGEWREDIPSGVATPVVLPFIDGAGYYGYQCAGVSLGQVHGGGFFIQ